jgi:hypothetical protein
MTPKFKFLRRVRIHGGECGAVARALHHEAQKVALIQNEQSLISDEKAFLSQADLEKSSKSTLNERKQMSTKTSIKRIALVAVSALGFGLMSVVPARAVEAGSTDVTEVILGTPGTARINQIVKVTVTFDMGAAPAADETLTARARIKTAPSGSTAAVGFSSAEKSMTDTDGENSGTVTIYAANAAGNELLPAAAVAAPLNTENFTNINTQVIGSVGLIPDKAGSYVVQVWHDADGDGLIDAAEEYDEVTFTVGNAIASVTVTKVNSTFIAVDGANFGALVKLTFKDSAGAIAGLADNETVSIDPSATGYISYVNGVDVNGAAGAAVTLDKDDIIGGVTWINVDADAAGTVTVDITGDGSTELDALSSSFTLSAKVESANADDGDWAVVGTSGTSGFFTGFEVPVGSSTMSWKYTIDSDETGWEDEDNTLYVGVIVDDNSGRVTGSVAQGILTLEYIAPCLVDLDAGTCTVSATMAATAVGQAYDVDSLTTADTDLDATVTASAIDTSDGSLTVSPSGTVRVAVGGTASFTVTARDQFGRLLAGSVTMNLDGSSRNPTTAATEVTKTLVDGRATFTVTDAPAAGVTATTDSVDFDVIGPDGDTEDATNVTIIWGTATAGSVTMTTYPGQDDTVAGTTSTDINAAAGGATGTSAALTATVKDADGNLLAGMPVTFAVSGLVGAEVHTTKVTVYTGAAGTASTNVSSYAAGKATVTATSGGKSATADIYFKQATATEARTVAATVSGRTITATVKDRYGNVVQGVALNATRVGSGFFGSGSSTSTGSTDKNGQVEFIFEGSATVTVAFADEEYGQTADVANKVGATAVTASAAGTATTNQAGLGAALAPAGINSVSIAVDAPNASATAAEAASDAAAEAIDAANAATDAANLAAEAADAATVAAEEARDAADAATAAVEELATQVATLMAALKAQITTLANTVAKIAKKVKA